MAAHFSKYARPTGVSTAAPNIKVDFSCSGHYFKESETKIRMRRSFHQTGTESGKVKLNKRFKKTASLIAAAALLASLMSLTSACPQCEKEKTSDCCETKQAPKKNPAHCDHNPASCECMPSISPFSFSAKVTKIDAPNRSGHKNLLSGISNDSALNRRAGSPDVITIIASQHQLLCNPRLYIRHAAFLC